MLRFAEPHIYTPVDDNLVLWISGRGRGIGSKVFDLSKKGNHGTIYGATWKNTPLGYSVLSFDGTDDYVNCGYFPKYKKSTVAVWVKSPKTQNAYAGIVFMGNGVKAWGLAINSGYVLHRISNGSSANEWYIEEYNEENYPEGWHFMVVTDNGTVRKYYKDGVFIAKRTNTLTNSGNNQLLAIGRWGNRTGADGYFNGTIDEIYIYNKALSAEEIREIYNMTKHLYGIWN